MAVCWRFPRPILMEALSPTSPMQRWAAVLPLAVITAPSVPPSRARSRAVRRGLAHQPVDTLRPWRTSVRTSLDKPSSCASAWPQTSASPRPDGGLIPSSAPACASLHVRHLLLLLLLAEQ